MSFVFGTKNRFLENLREKRVSIGVGCGIPSTELIDILGYVGYDYVMMDMMFGALTWDMAQNMITASHRSGMTPLVRIQVFPWGGRQNPGVASEVARALSVGATGVVISVSCKEEVEAALEPGRDWHRTVHTITSWNQSTFADYKKRVVDETLIIPMIESKGALDDIEDIMSMGIKVIYLGMTDLSRMVGSSEKLAYDHPKLIEALESIIEMGKQKGVCVLGNIGHGVLDEEEIIQRARNLIKRGVGAVTLRDLGWVIQAAAARPLNAVRESIHNSFG